MIPIRFILILNLVLSGLLASWSGYSGLLRRDAAAIVFAGWQSGLAMSFLRLLLRRGRSGIRAGAFERSSYDRFMAYGGLLTSFFVAMSFLGLHVDSGRVDIELMGSGSMFAYLGLIAVLFGSYFSPEHDPDLREERRDFFAIALGYAFCFVTTAIPGLLFEASSILVPISLLLGTTAVGAILMAKRLDVASLARVMANHDRALKYELGKVSFLVVPIGFPLAGSAFFENDAFMSLLLIIGIIGGVVFGAYSLVSALPKNESGVSYRIGS